MKGSELRFIEYMSGAKKRFIIPVYQRNYDWKIENCKQLYDDLIKVIRQKRKTHFFGSLVSVYDYSGRNMEFLVIDGQQRLTTVSLLLLAMYNLISKGILTPEDPSMAAEIYEEFLVDKYQPQETRIKLKPVKNDRRAFGKLFEKEENFIQTSNLTANYQYFYDRIQKQEISLDELFDAIHRLEIINITLNGDDNPQLIFESLNSTGLDLSEGDKIRNFILMGLPADLQDRYYENYWNPIEENTQYDVSAFIRDYLSIKLQKTPAQKRIYTEFKEYVETRSPETESLLIELLAYAKRYRTLLNVTDSDTPLSACILRMNRLGTTVTRPFFLEVLRLRDEHVLDASQVTDIFQTAESYLFRRSICDLPTNALDKIFLALHHEIMRYDGSTDDYVEKFKYALLNKNERTRFPNDDEFSSAFSERPVYSMKSKNKIYILERLENFGTRENKDVYTRYEEGIYTIEHIMPRHLTPDWIRKLGDDYEQIHELWLHRIANLTLTAYNSKYSNNSFQEKKTMPNGFDNSGIRMNNYISKFQNWTLKELEMRNEYLKVCSLSIWSMPATNYEPPEKQIATYTLDDVDEVAGRSISHFRFKNTEQPVKSWIGMYQKVLQILFSENKTIFRKLADSTTNDPLSVHFSSNPRAFEASEKIGTDLYVNSKPKTQSKLSVLRKLFNLYGEDPQDLVFYLRTESDRNEQKTENRGNTLRQNYWDFALDFIRATNKGNCFNNTTKSIGTSINGNIGINGFSICCIVTWHFARVELYLGKSEKEANKKAFDHLLFYKSEIESQLQIPLIWQRSDDSKSSKIYCQLNDVSIENEVDWLQMAQFHAKWSKKFYDILVPYLEHC